MEITFEKVNNEYIAEFEITTDSNLHIEKKCASSTKLYQRTNGGGWDLVDETKNMQGAVDDFDLSALVYPKFIKVVCNAEPLYAEVTTSGEVTEIKSQSKEIEVTSNGTTEVTPDAGFAYLNSVKVKTNVVQSGEGGGSSVEYLDVSGVSKHIKQTLLLLSLYAKVPQDIIIDASAGENQSKTTINAGVAPSSGTSVQMGELGLSSEYTDTLLSGITALGCDFSSKIVMQGQTMTLNEFFTMSGGKEMIDALPRLTEEEFYTL